METEISLAFSINFIFAEISMLIYHKICILRIVVVSNFCYYILKYFIVNVLPFPTFDSTYIFPLLFSIIDFAKDKPIVPVPQ